MRRNEAVKLPPPPSGDQLVSWAQLYRYMDNPFDILLFSLAVLGCLGSGAVPGQAVPHAAQLPAPLSRVVGATLLRHRLILAVPLAPSVGGCASLGWDCCGAP